MNLNDHYTVYSNNEKINDIYHLLYVEKLTEEEFIKRCDKDTGILECNMLTYRYFKGDAVKNRTKDKFEVIEKETGNYSKFKYFLNGEAISRKQLCIYLNSHETTIASLMLGIRKGTYKGCEIERIGGQYKYKAENIITGEVKEGTVSQVADHIGMKRGMMSQYCLRVNYFKKQWRITRDFEWSRK